MPPCPLVFYPLKENLWLNSGVMFARALKEIKNNNEFGQNFGHARWPIYWWEYNIFKQNVISYDYLIFYALTVRAREKGTQTKKEAEEGRRRRAKFAILLRLETKRKTSRNWHSLSYTLTLTEVEAKYGRDRD